MSTSVSNNNKQSQFHRAHENLKKWILEGRVTPGEHLAEVDLAESLGVSRTTTREVLIDLSKEGYVTLQPNRGAYVRSFTPEEAIEILQVRERLEGIAAGLAAENATSEDLGHLADIVESMVEAAAGEDSSTYSKLNRQFHARILATARNETVGRFIQQTRYQLVMRQYRNLRTGHPRPGSLDEHRAILVAIRGGDPVAAERMMRLHVSSAGAALRLDELSDV